jgi:tRNA ligase
LPELTAPPYYLTLKSNGCLILIAALSPSELLITSKHAIGQAKQENAVSHAEMGERWLDKGLKKVGKTREELAARLWKENWTCVAEVSKVFSRYFKSRV